MTTADELIDSVFTHLRVTLNSHPHQKTDLLAIADTINRFATSRSLVYVGPEGVLSDFIINLKRSEAEVRALVEPEREPVEETEYWAVAFLSEAHMVGRNIEVHTFPRTNWILSVDHRGMEWA